METFRELNNGLAQFGWGMFQRHEILANYKIHYIKTWNTREVYQFHVMCRREVIRPKAGRFKQLARKMSDRSLKVLLGRICNGDERKQNTKYDTGLAKATA